MYDNYIFFFKQKTAYEIEDQELSVSKVVFDVVPEYPEIKHVAEDVHPAAVHEHRGEDRQPYWRRTRKLWNDGPARHSDRSDEVYVVRDLIRHNRVRVCEFSARFSARSLLKQQEHNGVDDDDEVDNKRRGEPPLIIVSDGKEHLYLREVTQILVCVW